MSSRIVIDADGDMLLQFYQEPSTKDTSNENEEKKSETLELMVSSKVFSVASPVFKAMLNGSYKEGIDLAENKSSSQLYRLTLPDDDIDATTILARILHFNLTDISKKPSPSCLEKLAVLCDKYQCANAVKFCGGLWIRDWLLTYDWINPTIDDLCRILVFAYIADLPKEFVDIACKLFLCHKGPFLSPHTQVVILMDHPIVHKGLTRHLEESRLKCCRSFFEAMMAPVNQDWKTLSQSCYRAAKVVGTYLHHLRTLGILPLDIEFTQHKFCDLIPKVEQLPRISSEQYSCQRYECPCKDEPIYGLESDLIKEIVWISNQYKRLICLDCVKTDSRSKDEGKCRISHS